MCMKFKQDDIYSRQQGTGQPHIYIWHIEDFPIPIMSINQQKKLFGPLEELHRDLRQATDKVVKYEEEVYSLIESQFKEHQSK